MLLETTRLLINKKRTRPYWVLFLLSAYSPATYGSKAI
ncbi:hypothetical protein CHCC20375_1073 [Bacillus licheniformis]|nr:hypothetical protein CHCC20375_1073 [Bacillus licheniformis]